MLIQMLPDAERSMLSNRSFTVTRVGACTPLTATCARFDAWLAAGHQGAMAYLEGDGAGLRRDTRRPHEGETQALVLATP